MKGKEEESLPEFILEVTDPNEKVEKQFIFDLVFFLVERSTITIIKNVNQYYELKNMLGMQQ